MSAARSSSRAWLRNTAIVAVLLVVVGFAAKYLLRPTALVAAAKTDIAVRTVPGTVEVKAEYPVSISSEVGGRILTSTLDVGKKITKGEVLVQIDTGDIDIEIERIKNEITAAQKRVEVGSTLRAEVLNAKDGLEDAERRMMGGQISAADFEKQKRLYQQLLQKKELDEVNNQLLLDTHKNNLQAKQRDRSKMTIRAPADGVITAVMARPGDLLGGNATIATGISIGRTVEARISEENFAVVKLNQKASVRFLTFGADQYNAVVTKINPAADPTTRRYTLFLEIKLPEGRVLAPGITGEVSIVIEQRANAVTVPRRALAGDYVFVVEDGQVSRRKVTKGFEGLNHIEITSGLKAGELVVVEQQDRFSDGERVRTEVMAN